MTEPAYLTEARRCIGIREIKGPAHNKTITGWLAQLGAWWKDDETAWCGAFAAHCMQVAGIKYPSAWYRAKAWADWGRPLLSPIPGCIVVFSREGGGHVGFVVGTDKANNLLVLGGNQGDSVKISAFKRDRVLSYRWPSSMPLPTGALPLLSIGAELSRNEA